MLTLHTINIVIIKTIDILIVKKIYIGLVLPYQSIFSGPQKDMAILQAYIWIGLATVECTSDQVSIHQ